MKKQSLYTHIENERDTFKAKAKQARIEIMKLTVEAESFEEAASGLEYAIEKQVKADTVTVEQSAAQKGTL